MKWSLLRFGQQGGTCFRNTTGECHFAERSLMRTVLRSHAPALGLLPTVVAQEAQARVVPLDAHVKRVIDSLLMALENATTLAGGQDQHHHAKLLSTEPGMEHSQARIIGISAATSDAHAFTLVFIDIY